VGKVPKRSGGLIKYKREIELLKKELLHRIENEEFELAAKVRDQIRDLEKKLVES
jgi:protein arginine kinase activator